jgi:hypothetical protein
MVTPVFPGFVSRSLADLEDALVVGTPDSTAHNGDSHDSCPLQKLSALHQAPLTRAQFHAITDCHQGNNLSPFVPGVACISLGDSVYALSYSYVASDRKVSIIADAALVSPIFVHNESVLEGFRATPLYLVREAATPIARRRTVLVPNMKRIPRGMARRFTIYGMTKKATTVSVRPLLSPTKISLHP